MAQKNGLAIASLVLGLFFWLPIFGVLCSGLALIFGITALMNCKQNPQEYDGKILSVIGIVLGAIGLFLPVIITIFLLPIGTQMFTFLENYGFSDLLMPVYIFTLNFFFFIFALLGFTRLRAFTKSTCALISGFILSIAIVLPHVMNLYPIERDIIQIFHYSFPQLIMLIPTIIIAMIPLVHILKNKSTFYMLQVILVLGMSIIGYLIDIVDIFHLIFLIPVLSAFYLVFIFPIPTILFQYKDLLMNVNLGRLKIIMIFPLTIFPSRLLYQIFTFKQSVSSDGLDMTIVLLGSLFIGSILWLILAVMVFRTPDFFNRTNE
jgi:hypothetical protein